MDRAKFGRFVDDGLGQIVAVIGLPRTRRNQRKSIIPGANNGIFGACRPRIRQRIGQVDPPDTWQFVGGKPIQKRRGTGPLDFVLCKGCCVDQTHTVSDRLCFIPGITPPRPPPKRPRVVIKTVCSIQRAKIIGPLPAVYTTKLRAPRLHPLIAGRGFQRAAGRAFFVGMVQNIDMIITFLVLASRIFGCHPGPEPLGIK